MEFMPRWAPIVALAFLGAILATVLLGLGGVGAFVLRRPKLGRACMLIATGGLGAYGAVLLGMSVASREIVLRPGERKYFCELDCHIAYSVEKAERVTRLDRLDANGTFYVVTLKAWFDPESTSPRRPAGAPLRPNARQAVIVDAAGHVFPLSTAGEAALTRERGPQPSLEQELMPGESYSAQLVFELPNDAANPRLYLTDPSPENSFLFGHEQSPGHRKVLFALPESS